MSYNMSDRDNYILLINCWEEHFSGHCHDYNMTSKQIELFTQLKILFNSYGSIFFTYNPKPLKPMSSTTAAFIGSQVGGTAVGVASALEAKSKEEQYKKDMERYHEKNMKRYTTERDIKIVYDEIIKWINKNPKALSIYENCKKDYVLEREKQIKEEQIRREEEAKTKELERQKANRFGCIYCVSFVVLLILSIIIINIIL